MRIEITVPDGFEGVEEYMSGLAPEAKLILLAEAIEQHAKAEQAAEIIGTHVELITSVIANQSGLSVKDVNAIAMQMFHALAGVTAVMKGPRESAYAEDKDESAAEIHIIRMRLI